MQERLSRGQNRRRPPDARAMAQGWRTKGAAQQLAYWLFEVPVFCAAALGGSLNQ